MTDTANGFESCGITFGGGAPLFLLAGPCVIESAQHPLKMAKAIHAITSRLGIPYVFKASYDKANRSSVGNFRGPGAQEGLGILRAVKEETGLPIVTDIHSEAEIEDAAQVADILQIPAFLCRQTSLLVAAGQSGKIINIKKGQFMAPWDMKNAVDKTLSSGNGKILLTERGATFGYNNLVSDMRSLAMMRQYAPVVFDATHSAQLPGGQGGCSGGDREMAIVLARSAAAAGIDGVFMEVHDDPQNALCDGPNMIPLDQLEKLLETLLNIKQAAGV